MRVLRGALITLALSSSLAFSADKEFKRIVHAISDEYGQNPLNLWALSLVKPFVPAARTGMRGMDIAVFEDLGERRGEPGSLESRIRSIVGNTWKPLVQVRSRTETSLIYIREEGGDWRLLITSLEPGEATVVQMKLNPKSLSEWLTEPERSARNRHHHHDDE